MLKYITDNQIIHEENTIRVCQKCHDSIHNGIGFKPNSVSWMSTIKQVKKICSCDDFKQVVINVLNKTIIDNYQEILMYNSFLEYKARYSIKGNKNCKYLSFRSYKHLNNQGLI